MQSIWSKKFEIKSLNDCLSQHLSKLLDINYTEIGSDFLKATMDVSEKHWQPYGVLHGGASVVLAESLASCAANLCLNQEIEMAVGQEINANHLRSFKEGQLIGIAKPIHIGKKSHVWEVKITDSKNEKLVCISRMTAAIIPRS